jgi:heme-degrading monooxygenase HmoA
MIKVIEGYKVRLDEDIQPILHKLRSNAMQYPGFVSAEYLISKRDRSFVVVVSTWNNEQSWAEWETATVRQRLLEQARGLLVDNPRIGLYRVSPTIEWAE